MSEMILVEVSRCLGCRTCEVACALAHANTDQLKEALQQNAKSRVTVRTAADMAAPVQCRHCDDPPCVEACPTDALEKQDDGRVTVDQEVCVGCGVCVRECPYGAVRMGPDEETIIKCDLCIDRLNQGRRPACVSACPTGALRFGTVEELVTFLDDEGAEEARRAAEKGDRVILVGPQPHPVAERE